MFTSKESKKDTRTTEEQSNTSNIIGKDTVLEGSIESVGNIRIEGKIFGHAKAKAKLVMGSEATVDGNVTARTAEIAGTINGNIEISELLILKPSAVIKGDILTNKLVVEPGATFNGGCKMGHLAKEIEIGKPASQTREAAIKRA
ncbi:cytoskeletal protein CcmA (bactofilin family) [Roseivirga ehrenbergii]|uniref:Cell shape determination protein CcmA n=1 Tax=Roseivirga ehrenbergii (strain DSM 102268 / JCM 13514 / KCTC 12282 / NCIMB 14502 / KMM 6017) TaxID=279360 RepID=A0A150XCC3_ROSEK|nr:polymer-forming cytoskeletal protein [Roseivirga ehrenbergii]KYG76342.1 cell shape determination protein CcmA [Roseivirga ehrenbergii]TCL00121.1 cytoskeletal protein CcmA (bactofilin family) [Roseivirga ehrenbergii]